MKSFFHEIIYILYIHMYVYIYTHIIEPPNLQQGSCVTTNGFGCTLNGCCNPAAQCGSNSICTLPCVPSSSATFAPTSSPTFSTCLCNWSTAGCKTNSDCCPGLECNVYNGWSICRGKDADFNVYILIVLAY